MTPSFTDPFFAKVIADISANGTLYFTRKQLFYLLSKRLNKKTTPVNYGFSFVSVFGAVLIFSIGLGISSVNPKNAASTEFVVTWGVLILIPLFPIIQNIAKIILQKIMSLGEFTLTQEQFQEWLNAWLIVNKIPEMLTSVTDHKASTSVRSDLGGYSFDRAVICDSAEIAQLLIANNFHFENNCALLSITGYPQSIFSTVMQMLRRNPELKVYALHDASPNGVKLVHRLRTNPNWFENSNVMIYDVGLLPHKLLKNRNLFVQKSEESALQAKQLPDQVRQNLSRDELKWLEQGKYVELEFFSPQRIIKILNKGISRSQDSTDSFG